MIRQYNLENIKFHYNETINENGTIWTYNTTLENSAVLTIIVSFIYYLLFITFTLLNV